MTKNSETEISRCFCAMDSAVARRSGTLGAAGRGSSAAISAAGGAVALRGSAFGAAGRPLVSGSSKSPS